MKIYLIRHGSTEAGEAHLYCGSSDVPLSEKGRGALTPSSLSPDIVISSPLLRCIETAQILFPHRNIKISSELREMDFGRFELHSYEELKFDKAYIDWITDVSGDFICPGGESKNTFFRRVSDAFLHELSQLDCGSAAFILHGGVIGALMELYCTEKKPYYEWKPPYGGGFAVKASRYTLTFDRYL